MFSVTIMFAVTIIVTFVVAVTFAVTVFVANAIAVAYVCVPLFDDVLRSVLGSVAELRSIPITQVHEHTTTVRFPSNLRVLVCSHRGSFAVGWVCFGLGLLRACAWFGIVVLPRPCWSCGLSIYIVIYTTVSLPLLRYSMLLPIPLT